MKGYQLKITIKGSKPPIWRRVVVPEQITFYQLHQVIQEAFGWENDHLHEFEFKKPGLLVRDHENDEMGEWDARDVLEEGTLIDDLIKENPRFVYTYDFGDAWEHQILLEKEVDYENSYPQVVKYKGDNIPEDCGGIGGYYDLLEQLEDLESGDYESMKDWAEQQGMAEYNLEEANSHMKKRLVFGQKSRKDGKGQEDGQQKDGKQEAGRQEAGKQEAGKQEDGQQKDGKLEDRQQEHESRTELEAVDTLEELYSQYDKSELLRIARVHHLQGCDDLGKGGLVSLLVKEILDPERMGRFFGSISDQAAAEFEKAAACKGMEYQGDAKVLSFLHCGGYCGLTGRGTIVVTADAAEAYNAINTEEFHSRRSRRHLVWACCKAAVYLYGVAAPDRVENVCKAAGSDADAKEILRLYKEMKDIWTSFAYLDGVFFDWDLLEEDAYKKVFRYQQGKTDYIPSLAQIMEIDRTGVTEPKKHVRPLKAFLLSMVGCDDGTAESAALSIHHYVRLGGTPGGVEEIMEHYGLNLDSQEKMDGFDGIMERVWRDTRAIGRCGYTRTELEAQTARIDPNAPCPCGSGKRYRQCCGRDHK